MAESIDQKKILGLADAVGRSYSYRDSLGNGVAITCSPDGTLSVGQYVGTKYLFVATSRKDITTGPQAGTDLEYVAERLEELIDPKPSIVDPVDTSTQRI